MSTARTILSRGKIATALALAIFLLLLDRGLKMLALSQGSAFRLPLAPGLAFNYQPNPQLSFSLPVGGPWLLPILSLITVAVLVLAVYNFQRQQRLIALLLTIIGICAITNIMDRYLYGAVIDYLELFSISVINLADVLISLSCGSLLIVLLKRGERIGV